MAPFVPAAEYEASVEGPQVTPTAGTGSLASATFWLAADGGSYSVEWDVQPAASAPPSGLWLRFGAVGGLPNELAAALSPPIDLTKDAGLPWMGRAAISFPAYASIANHLASVEIAFSGAVMGRGQVLPRPSSYATVRVALPDGGVGAGGHFVIPRDGGTPIAGRSVYHLEFPGIGDVRVAQMHQGGPGGTGPVLLPLTLVVPATGWLRAVGTYDAVALASSNTDGGIYLDVEDGQGAHFRGQLVIHR